MQPTHVSVHTNSEGCVCVRSLDLSAAIDISRDRDHVVDALRGDNGAWGRMSKGRRAALEALNDRERHALLAHLQEE